MDAAPLLARIAEALQRHNVDAVLIGNSAAAVHGAPVTTLDFDFMFRNAPSSRTKLKAVAAELGACLYVPYELRSGTLRMQNEDYHVLVDFLPTIAGIRSYDGLRKRAVRVPAGKAVLLVATLADIIKSKKAAGRPKDTAVLAILEQTLEEATRGSSEEATGIPQESDREHRDMIRGLLALPIHKRTHFLRRLIGVGGSSAL